MLRFSCYGGQEVNFFYEKVSRVFARERLEKLPLYDFRKVIFTTKPSFMLLFRKLKGDYIIYLNWRSVFTRPSGVLNFLRDCRQLFSLFVSDIVLTNDIRTKVELSYYGIKAFSIPFFVDCDLLLSVKNSLVLDERSNYVVETAASPIVILILGDNDRDDELVRRVADVAPDHLIFIRITRNAAIQSIYDGSSRVKLLFDINLEEYVSNILRSSLVWLPVRSDVHAAGQTSCLEALYFGKKVISNSKKLRSIFLKDSNFKFYSYPTKFHSPLNVIPFCLIDIIVDHICTGSGGDLSSIDYSKNFDKFDAILTELLQDCTPTKNRSLIIL